MSNSLLPTIDSSISIFEMADDKLVDLHSKIHIIFNGLQNGRVQDDWTYEECLRIHDDILRAMNQNGIPHLDLGNNLLDKRKLPKISSTKKILKKAGVEWQLQPQK